MTEVGGPWSACSNTCGWGMQSRIKCGKEEFKKCFGQDCPAHPDCTAFNFEFTQSRVKTRLDIDVKMKRYPSIEDSIISQRIQIVNNEDRTNGAARTWLMTKENDKNDRPSLFEKKIETSCDQGRRMSCKASADNCLYSF